MLNDNAHSSFLRKDSLTSDDRIAFYQKGDAGLEKAAKFYAGAKNAIPVSSESDIMSYYELHASDVRDEIMLFMHSGDNRVMTFNSDGPNGIPVNSNSPLWKVLGTHLWTEGTISFMGCGLGGNEYGQQYVTDIAGKVPGFKVRAPMGNSVRACSQGDSGFGVQTLAKDDKPIEWQWYSKKL